MEQFFIVLNQIGIFLILIIFGILAVKFGILDAHSLGSVSKLVMRMALPAYIFINTAEGATRQGLAESLLVIPLAIALYLMLFLLSLLLEKVFQLKGNRSHVFRAIVMFGNVGFMGIPLVVELYPDTALLYISLFTILDQGLFWTYGVSLTKPVSDQKEKVSLKNLKNLLSPALIAIVGATILVLLDIHLPKLLITTLSKLGASSMPLSLLYIGGMLSMTDVRKVLRCGELYAEIGMKMLVLPLVFFMVMKLLNVPADMAGTMTFLTGLPAINMVAMLSKNNGSDGDYAVCAVMMTTIACLITLPLVSLGLVMLA
ncbi:MAG: AEC family transporter [Oscillospiraceae bacterium]|nr:AEC family transporter [Oscillospiraceae bacterium]